MCDDGTKWCCRRHSAPLLERCYRYRSGMITFRCDLVTPVDIVGNGCPAAPVGEVGPFVNIGVRDDDGWSICGDGVSSETSGGEVFVTVEGRIASPCCCGCGIFGAAPEVVCECWAVDEVVGSSVV